MAETIAEQVDRVLDAVSDDWRMADWARIVVGASLAEGERTPEQWIKTFRGHANSKAEYVVSKYAWWKPLVTWLRQGKNIEKAPNGDIMTDEEGAPMFRELKPGKLLDELRLVVDEGRIEGYKGKDVTAQGFGKQMANDEIIDLLADLVGMERRYVTHENTHYLGFNYVDAELVLPEEPAEHDGQASPTTQAEQAEDGDKEYVYSTEEIGNLLNEGKTPTLKMIFGESEYSDEEISLG